VVRERHLEAALAELAAGGQLTRLLLGAEGGAPPSLT
jgi:hypothetical protein